MTDIAGRDILQDVRRCASTLRQGVRSMMIRRGLGPSGHRTSYLRKPKALNLSSMKQHLESAYSYCSSCMLSARWVCLHVLKDNLPALNIISIVPMIIAELDLCLYHECFLAQCGSCNCKHYAGLVPVDPEEWRMRTGSHRASAYVTSYRSGLS